MNKITIIATIISAIPLASAFVLAAANQPKHFKFEEPKSLIQMDIPIDNKVINVIEISEVVVVGRIYKKKEIAKQYSCEDWRDSLYGGKVRLCEEK